MKKNIRKMRGKENTITIETIKLANPSCKRLTLIRLERLMIRTWSTWVRKGHFQIDPLAPRGATCIFYPKVKLWSYRVIGRSCRSRKAFALTLKARIGGCLHSTMAESEATPEDIAWFGKRAAQKARRGDGWMDLLEIADVALKCRLIARTHQQMTAQILAATKKVLKDLLCAKKLIPSLGKSPVVQYLRDDMRLCGMKCAG
jgi:hypothetical protein